MISSTSCTREATSSCPLVIWYKPAAGATAPVRAIGAWDAWARPGLALLPSEDGWLRAEVAAHDDELAYALSAGGSEFVNPFEALTANVDGREVSVGRRTRCESPALSVVGVETHATGAGFSSLVTLQYVAAGDGAPLVSIREEGGARVERDGAMARVSLSGLQQGKHRLRFRARDAAGRAVDRDAFVWAEREPRLLADWSIYQVMIDRFRGPGGQPLSAPASMTSRAGGQLRGVTQFITSGEFEASGWNAVWLSPVYRNPDGYFIGRDGRPQQGYHGYWPISEDEIDPRIGTEGDLRDLVTAAHARSVRVMLDVVPNHVHQEHPLVAEHADWFRDATTCVCGQSCDWATAIERCAFATYLPDVNWNVSAAAYRFSAATVNWVDRFDLDGLRIDAVPMMPRGASRRIALTARDRLEHPGHELYLLGEHFTGPDGYVNLRYDLGPYGVNGAFDFPLMWALRGALAEKSVSLTNVADAVDRGVAAWGDAHATMATMIGNHDVPRFVTVAAGDADGDPWVPASQPTTPEPYAKQALALELIFALPGVPVVYYGDEVALAGHADPDARRVMPSEGSLTALQRGVRERVARIGKLRACSAPLRRGTYRLVAVRDEWWVFERRSEAATALVVVSRTPKGAELAAVDGKWRDAFSDAEADGNVAVDAQWSLRVFLREGDACLGVGGQR